jgi:hypothetical protein
MGCHGLAAAAAHSAAPTRPELVETELKNESLKPAEFQNVSLEQIETASPGRDGIPPTQGGSVPKPKRLLVNGFQTNKR